MNMKEEYGVTLYWKTPAMPVHAYAPYHCDCFAAYMKAQHTHSAGYTEEPHPVRKRDYRPGTPCTGCGKPMKEPGL